MRVKQGCKNLSLRGDDFSLIHNLALVHRSLQGGAKSHVGNVLCRTSCRNVHTLDEISRTCCPVNLFALTCQSGNYLFAKELFPEVTCYAGKDRYVLLLTYCIYRITVRLEVPTFTKTKAFYDVINERLSSTCNPP